MFTLEHGIVSCFKCLIIPRKVQDHAKEFLRNKKNILIKRFIGKATGHNDYYMRNIGSQRPKIGIIDR